VIYPISIFQETAPSLLLEESGSKGQIVADGLVICQTNSIIEGIACWIACYPIFNIAYPTKYKNSLIFIRKFLLGINDDSKTPMKVIDAISKINTHSNKAL